MLQAPQLHILVHPMSLRRGASDSSGVAIRAIQSALLAECYKREAAQLRDGDVYCVIGDLPVTRVDPKPLYIGVYHRLISNLKDIVASRGGRFVYVESSKENLGDYQNGAKINSFLKEIGLTLDSDTSCFIFGDDLSGGVVEGGISVCDSFNLERRPKVIARLTNALFFSMMSPSELEGVRKILSKRRIAVDKQGCDYRMFVPEDVKDFALGELHNYQSTALFPQKPRERPVKKSR